MTQGSASRLLASIFRAHRGRILLTYGLVLSEETLGLLYPLVIGLAINGLVTGSLGGLWVYVGVYLVHVVIATLRQMYDTRTYSHIYSRLATDTVLEQQRQSVELSQVAARSAMMREFIDFFESDIPRALHSLFAVVGALVMLALYDPLVAAVAFAVFVPVVLINRHYLRLAYRLNRGLNNQYEREVIALESRRPERIRKHYGLVAFWEVRLSDAESGNYALAHLFMLGLLAFTIYRAASVGELQAGTIYAMVAYAWSFIEGMDSVPWLVQQVSRLRDIGRRVSLSST